MKNNIFHIHFIEEIKKKVPQRNKVVVLLTNLLGIEKEAVYRRMRGEVPFTFSEVALISRKLSISIDEVVVKTSKRVSAFKMRMVEFNEPHDHDLSFIRQLTEFIDFINNPVSETAEATNILPKAWAFRYESLIRFYLFKWLYQYDTKVPIKPYKEIAISEKMSVYYKRYVQAATKIADTRYVLDFRLFEYLINDLHYFHSIRLITDEELESIQADLYKLLDYIESLSISGKYAETGNRVEIYISSLNFESNYSYIKTSSYHITFIKAFILNVVTSFDKKTFEKVQTWIQAQIKSSTLITESGEMDRVRFFNKQREMIAGIAKVSDLQTILY